MSYGQCAKHTFIQMREKYHLNCHALRMSTLQDHTLSNASNAYAVYK